MIVRPLLVLAALLAATPAAAQVGHAPGSSPYRDIRASSVLTPWAGWFGTNAGSYGVGPNDGYVFGGRYSFRSNKFVEFGLAGGYGKLQRNLVDPFVRLANRTTGPVDENIVFTEASFQFNLTGGKTWNRLAPFIGLGAGMAFGKRNAADTSGYNFGSKFAFSPGVGFRFFITDQIHLRAEAKAVFWKLSYPTSFGVEPVLEPGTTTNPNAVIKDGIFKEWVPNPMVSVGIGVPFKFF